MVDFGSVPLGYQFDGVLGETGVGEIDDVIVFDHPETTLTVMFEICQTHNG
jgi:hypothetical protein